MVIVRRSTIKSDDSKKVHDLVKCHGKEFTRHSFRSNSASTNEQLACRSDLSHCLRADQNELSIYSLARRFDDLVSEGRSSCRACLSQN